MKSIRRAMYVCVSLAMVIALTFDIALKLKPTTVSASANAKELKVDKSYSIDNINDKIETLEDKASELIEESAEEIDHYSKLYNDSYGKELRLSHKHITYSSRLTLKEQNFIKDNITVNSYRESAASLDLRSISSVTAYEIDEYILKGTALEGLGSSFVRAELEHGVNAIFLLSLGIHESAWGKSAIAKDKNNLFGFGAYDKSPYQSAVHFGTKGEGVNRVAKHLSETYLAQGGRYYSGGYTLWHVNQKYASDSKWSSNIAITMDGINKKIMSKQNTKYHEELYLIGEDENGKAKYSKLFKAKAI